MTFLRRLLGRSSRSANPEQLATTLNSFMLASTWEESQKVVEEHPELLSEEADSLLGGLAQAVEDVNVRTMVMKYQTLLRRCREVGIPRAFAEQVLSPDALAEAARLGLTPEEFLDQLRAAEGMPPAIRDVLAELAEQGVEVHNKEELEKALATRPDLRESLERATWIKREVPSVFQDNVTQALEAEEHYGRDGDQVALEQVVAAWEQILNSSEFSGADERFRLMAMSEAGRILLLRFQVQGRLSDLNHALDLSRGAAQGTKANSPDLPIYLTNLGEALRSRYHCTGRAEDLEEAIRAYRSAVQSTPVDSPALYSRLNNLGAGLADRYTHMKQFEDLEEAISVYQRAVKSTPSDCPDLPGILSNLGNALKDRFGRMQQLKDLDEAIELYQSAVQRTSIEYPSRPVYINNLGTGLRTRYKRNGQQKDLEEAIRVFKSLVNDTPADSPLLPAVLVNLGDGLCDRYVDSGRVEDRNEAIQCYRRACKLGELRAPQIVLRAARHWGRWAVERQQWAEADEAYDIGLATGRQILARQLQRVDKESTLRDMQEMPAPAAYVLAKLARYEDAVTRVERGRARLLAEALERNRRDLERLPALGYEDLYWRYQEVVAMQEQLTQPAAARTDRPDYMTGQERLDAIVAANVAFDQVVADIQQVPGYADFLAEPNFAQIQATAQASPLVYLVASAVGGLALIVYSGNVQPIWLDGLTEAGLREWLGPANDPAMGGWLGAYRRRKENNAAWLDTIAETTHLLWTQVMGPVAEALHQLPPSASSSAAEVTLIPSGLLALLPLHAAWTDDAEQPTTGRRYFLDEFAVNYAPSALALRFARTAAATQPDQRLLAIDEPKPVDAIPLTSAQLEVDAIAALFDTPVIKRHEQANLQEIREALLPADVVHFACHGANDWDNPLESGLCMAHNQLLTVRDLLGLEHAAGRLAVLSACETGIVGIELPDEVVALPSALLQVGFGGVVASLWSVADISTAMLMVRFYEYWHNEGLTPVHALRAAQCWLRDTSNRQKEAYFEQFSPARSGVQIPGAHMPETVALAFVAKAKTLDMKKETFAHPYWWAAFYLTGV